MLRHRGHKSAVVAFHSPPRFVVGERNRAIAALKLFAACPAQNDGGISATVQQHHDLLAALEAVFDLGSQFPRNDLLAAGFLAEVFFTTAFFFVAFFFIGLPSLCFVPGSSLE